jgi:hypothetical protein
MQRQFAYSEEVVWPIAFVSESKVPCQFRVRERNADGNWCDPSRVDGMRHKDIRCLKAFPVAMLIPAQYRI